MKVNQMITALIIAAIWMFGVSCQHSQKKGVEKEAVEEQEAMENHENGEDEDEDEVIFNFDDAQIGALPEGWTSARTGKGNLGIWKVVKDKSAPSSPNVLAQMSKENLGYHFSLAVADNTNYTDVEIELKFKAVDGQEDQGGGPVWRYQDPNNYYICRANPLESNFRVYKVVDGNRKQLKSARVDIPSGQWHSLKIENKGDHIQCWYNDKLYLDVRDDTFKDGKIGVWTKADAVTYFDDIKVETED